MRRSYLIFVLLTVAFAITTTATAATPAPALAVFPAEINLSTTRARQSFVVQAKFPDGITRDVTKLTGINITS